MSLKQGTEDERNNIPDGVELQIFEVIKFDSLISFLTSSVCHRSELKTNNLSAAVVFSLSMYS